MTQAHEEVEFERMNLVHRFSRPSFAIFEEMFDEDEDRDEYIFEQH